MDTLLSKFDLNIYGKDLLKFIIEKELNKIRKNIKSGKVTRINEDEIINSVRITYHNFIQGSLKPVINATGIVIHTNLGRAPLSEKTLENIKNTVCGYSNLEYDLQAGKRGERYHHIKEFLTFLTGAENAVIVNNNASAVFLVLNTFCNKKNVLVSRGELVEIGGSFRIPDVMSGSGAILKEIGTTNKTKKSDYLNNVDDNTAMMMKVHTSNYKITGFTESVNFSEIPALASKKNVLSYYDAGSGSFIGENIGDCKEPSIKETVKSGFDLISFSGDKMLGAAQAGIIIGKSELIEKIKENPLMRMLRVDKLTLSVLQETLKYYIEDKAFEIPAVKMLYEKADNLQVKAELLLKTINDAVKLKSVKIDIIKSKTYVGGGSCPLEEIETVVLILESDKHTPNQLEKYFRNQDIPIIGRIKDDKFMLDVRTIFEKQFVIIAEALKQIG